MDPPRFRPCQATILVVAVAVAVVVQEAHPAHPPQPTHTVFEVVPEYEDRARVVSTAYTPALTALHGLSLPHLVPLLGTPRSPPKKGHVSHNRRERYDSDTYLHDHIFVLGGDDDTLDDRHRSSFSKFKSRLDRKMEKRHPNENEIARVRSEKVARTTASA